MKTNQIMTRDAGFIQRTKDGYFNATKLIEHHNKSGGQEKQMQRYKVNASTKDFVEQLKKEGIIKPIIASSGSGESSGTWMHPKLFIDFAMWLSVEFKSKVIDYVLDGLILSRNDAGDYYNQMCAQILTTYVDVYGIKPPAKVFIGEANLIKSLVTNKERNDMTEQELRQITYLQKVNANLISKGMGKDARLKRLKQASEIQI